VVRRIDRDMNALTGVARVDRRTKDLAKRIGPGEVAVIDHEDLDRVAAETLIEANVGAIVNASASISGRYPNVGPLLVAAAGIPLLDNVGAKVLDRVADGALVTISGNELRLRGETIATGSARASRRSRRRSTRLAGPWAASSNGLPRTRCPTSRRKATCSSTAPTSPRCRSSSKAGRH